MVLQMIDISKTRIIGAIRTAPPHSQFLPSMIMSRLVQARYINSPHRLKYATLRSQYAEGDTYSALTSSRLANRAEYSLLLDNNRNYMRNDMFSCDAVRTHTEDEDN